MCPTRRVTPRAWGRTAANTAPPGYPQVRLLALVACGTRAVIDAVFGSRSDGETTHAKRLLRSLHPRMIVLLDRGFDSNTFLGAVAGTGAQVFGPVERQP